MKNFISTGSVQRAFEVGAVDGIRLIAFVVDGDGLLGRLCTFRAFFHQRVQAHDRLVYLPTSTLERTWLPVLCAANRCSVATLQRGFLRSLLESGPRSIRRLSATTSEHTQHLVAACFNRASHPRRLAVLERQGATLRDTERQ